MKVEKIFYTVVAAGLIYSLMGFAYMHNTFITKDIGTIILNELAEIKRMIHALKRN